MKDMSRFFLLLLLITVTACGGKKYEDAKVSPKGAITISFLSGAEHEPDPAPTAEPEQAPTYNPGDKLISSKWGQSYPFNGLIPKIDGQEFPTGCTTTALAQLVNYYRPSIIRQTLLQHNTMAPEGILRYGNYLYDQISAFNADPVQNEVGMIEVQKLIRDIGYTMSTSYHPDGSSTSLSHLPDFLKAFGFKNTYSRLEAAATVDANNNFVFQLPSSLKEAIIESINKFEPVILSMSGREITLPENADINTVSEQSYTGDNSTSFDHLTIIDGYKIDEDGRFLVHINWGWDGRRDGFYSLDGGIKLHRIKSETLQTLTYIPEIEIYYGFTKCESEIDCPATASELLATRYQESSGLITSSSSANHSSTPIATLVIDSTPMIKNQSGFFKLKFKNIETGDSFYYNFTQYASNHRTTLNYNGSNFPHGTYEVSFSSLNTTEVDLSRIPIRFFLTRQNSGPFNMVDLPADTSTPTTTIGLDANSPLIIPAEVNKTILIPILNPSSEKIFELKLLAGDGKVELMHDYLLIKQIENTQSQASKIKIGLFAKDYQNAEILVEEKEFVIIRGHRQLLIANPSTTFSGSVQNGRSNTFYVYAGGYCEVSGSRGFSNQAFFYSIESVNGQEFDRASNNIRLTRLTKVEGLDATALFEFPVGLYRVTASPTFSNRSYSIDSNTNFNLTFDCDQSSSLDLNEMLNFYQVDSIESIKAEEVNQF